MDIEAAQRRLATHTSPQDVEREPEPERVVELETVVKAPEPVVKSVADIIRHPRSNDARFVYELLKVIGALVEDGETLVYKLSKPLAPPPPNVADEMPNMVQLRFSRVLTMAHLAQMRVYGEFGIPVQAVHASWVVAMTGRSLSVINRLHYNDAHACMTIAQVIEADAGNE